MTIAEALEYLDSMARMENVTGSAEKARRMAHAVAVLRATVEVGAMVGFIADRVACHLAHGCDTAERARELALSEWDVGVMGVRR